jgi:hypothetical protein
LPADRICSSLETHFLPSLEVEFEALSYTWGSTENNAEIHLGDHEVPVTTNLFEALQALRFQGKPPLQSDQWHGDATSGYGGHADGRRCTSSIRSSIRLRR